MELCYFMVYFTKKRNRETEFAVCLAGSTCFLYNRNRFLGNMINMINMMVSHALTPLQSKTHPGAEWISTCSDIAFKVPDLWRKMEKENKDAPGKKVCTVCICIL